jgi:hypothetical protein
MRAIGLRFQVSPPSGESGSLSSERRRNIFASACHHQHTAPFNQEPSQQPSHALTWTAPESAAPPVHLRFHPLQKVEPVAKLLQLQLRHSFSVMGWISKIGE